MEYLSGSDDSSDRSPSPETQNRNRCSPDDETRSQTQREPAAPTYMSEDQRNMLNALLEEDLGLLTTLIDRAERDHSIKYEKSRIRPGMEWRPKAITLIASAAPNALEALFQGTMPQRALSGDIEDLVRLGDEEGWRSQERDPIIYANWLADKAGMGLSPDDFELFLTRLEMAVKLRPDPEDHGITTSMDYERSDMVSAICQRPLKSVTHQIANQSRSMPANPIKGSDFKQDFTDFRLETQPWDVEV